MKVADDYLEGREDDIPLLALPAPGDDQAIAEGFDLDDKLSMGGVSQMTGVSKLSDRNFISINKSAAGRTRMVIGQRVTDRLAPDQRERLEAMVAEIDENIDELVKEKEAYFKQDG